MNGAGSKTDPKPSKIEGLLGFFYNPHSLDEESKHFSTWTFNDLYLSLKINLIKSDIGKNKMIRGLKATPKGCGFSVQFKNRIGLAKVA